MVSGSTWVSFAGCATESYERSQAFVEGRDAQPDASIAAGGHASGGTGGTSTGGNAVQSIDGNAQPSSGGAGALGIDAAAVVADASVPDASEGDGGAPSTSLARCSPQPRLCVDEPEEVDSTFYRVHNVYRLDCKDGGASRLAIQDVTNLHCQCTPRDPSWTDCYGSLPDKFCLDGDRFGCPIALDGVRTRFSALCETAPLVGDYRVCDDGTTRFNWRTSESTYGLSFDTSGKLTAGTLTGTPPFIGPLNCGDNLEFFTQDTAIDAPGVQCSVCSFTPGSEDCVLDSAGRLSLPEHPRREPSP
jgi:hypothetical protein